MLTLRHRALDGLAEECLCLIRATRLSEEDSDLAKPRGLEIGIGHGPLDHHGFPQKRCGLVGRAP